MMKFYTLGCPCCNGKDPIIGKTGAGQEALLMFRTREAAQLRASEMDVDGQPPTVIEVEVKQV